MTTDHQKWESLRKVSRTHKVVLDALKEREAAVREAYNLGNNLREIGERIGKSHETVRKMVGPVITYRVSDDDPAMNKFRQEADRVPD